MVPDHSQQAATTGICRETMLGGFWCSGLLVLPGNREPPQHVWTLPGQPASHSNIVASALLH